MVALVNGDPITALDVTQRAKLIEISTRKAPTRQEALEELIDEKLKLYIARRYKLDISEKEVDAAFNGIATRAGSTPQQFTQALLNAGITADAVKSRLKAEMAWNQIIRGKFQADFQSARARHPRGPGVAAQGRAIDGRLRIHVAADPADRPARIRGGRGRGAAERGGEPARPLPELRGRRHAGARR